MKLNRAENIAWLSELLIRALTEKKLRASLPSFGGYFHLILFKEMYH